MVKTPAQKTDQALNRIFYDYLQADICQYIFNLTTQIICWERICYQPLSEIYLFSIFRIICRKIFFPGMDKKNL